jgi:hypothetical protein
MVWYNPAGACPAAGPVAAGGTAEADGVTMSRLAQVTATIPLTVAAATRARRSSRPRAAAADPFRTFTVLPFEFPVDVLLVMGLTSPDVVE